MRKAVVPAAGLGTRFLPATKAIPKEMLPLVDRPTIQYALEEVVASGINQAVVITSATKNAIADHFDRAPVLEEFLEARGQSDKMEALEPVNRLMELLAIAFVRQPRPLGLGHAILTAGGWIGDEPCAALLPDDVILGDPPCLRQLLDVHRQTGATVLAVRRMPAEQLSRYGVVSVKSSDGAVHEVDGMVEKPRPGTEPSDLAVLGRYVLHHQVVAELESVAAGAGGEIQLTDAIRASMGKVPVYAVEFSGDLHDTGTVLGLMRANFLVGLTRPELRDSLLELARLVAREGAPIP